jgi:hypothetical protein
MVAAYAVLLVGVFVLGFRAKLTIAGASHGGT